MEILNKQFKLSEIIEMEPTYFEDMVKGVVDVNLGLLALNAEMHVDLEQLLLDNGSNQEDLVGLNIYYDDGDIELDSNINPPVNRRLGYPRGGRLITDANMVATIKAIVERWVKLNE